MANNTQLRCSKCGGDTVRAENRVARGYECFCACGHVYTSNSVAAGVSFERFQRGTAVSNLQDAGAGEGATFTAAECRDQAADCLREAEKALQALIGTYGEGISFSAMHPKAGFTCALDQVKRLRKSIAKSRV